MLRMLTSSSFSAVLALFGAVFVVFGVFQVSVPAGWIVLGAVLVLISYVVRALEVMREDS